eukprot:4073733-Amphidinium_carterae.1
MDAQERLKSFFDRDKLSRQLNPVASDPLNQEEWRRDLGLCQVGLDFGRHCVRANDGARECTPTATTWCAQRSPWACQSCVFCFSIAVKEVLRFDDAGTVGLAYRYSEAVSLQELLERGRRLQTEELYTIASWLLQVLQGAHHRGVVHADMQPKYILVNVSEDGKLITPGMICGWSSAVIVDGEARAGCHPNTVGRLQERRHSLETIADELLASHRHPGFLRVAKHSTVRVRTRTSRNSVKLELAQVHSYCRQPGFCHPPRPEVDYQLDEVVALAECQDQTLDLQL